MAKSKNTTRVLFSVDPDEYRTFKALVISEDRSIREVLEELMVKYIKQEREISNELDCKKTDWKKEIQKIHEEEKGLKYKIMKVFKKMF